MLSIQSSLELPLAMVVDDLHCIYLGVTKLLLKYWFGKEYRTKDFSIRRKVHVYCVCATSTICTCTSLTLYACAIKCYSSVCLCVYVCVFPLYALCYSSKGAQ